ncbi:hypothetical protein C8R45DRAFT_117431 [Mycena sanguinolenta]|nr:hypothetical protein C8R45DRAFT_117431 [Mycena sanguinolenta]
MKPARSELPKSRLGTTTSTSGAQLAPNLDDLFFDNTLVCGPACRASFFWLLRSFSYAALCTNTRLSCISGRIEIAHLRGRTRSHYPRNGIARPPHPLSSSQATGLCRDYEDRSEQHVYRPQHSPWPSRHRSGARIAPVLSNRIWPYFRQWFLRLYRPSEQAARPHLHHPFHPCPRFLPIDGLVMDSVQSTTLTSSTYRHEDRNQASSTSTYA